MSVAACADLATKQMMQDAGRCAPSEGESQTLTAEEIQTMHEESKR